MTVVTAARRWLAAVPLRIGLVVVLLLLASVVLLVSGVVTTTVLHRSLTDRVDEQLVDAARSWARPRPMRQVRLDDGRQVWVPADSVGAVAPPGGTPPGQQPRRFYELRRSPTGMVYLENPGSAEGQAHPEGTAPTAPSPPHTVGSVGAPDITWRIMTTRNEYGSVTIGLPLTENHRTITRVILVEAVTGISALLVLAGIGQLIVSRSLRPLRQVEHTAAAIADGDMDRRVPVRGVDTEVDNLARSLNTMLATIQTAVASAATSEEHARRSETRMRQFVADASHELRTPLTTIRGFAELYRQGAQSDASAVLSRVESEAERMGLLVEDLLVLAQLDEGRPLAQKPVDVLAVAADVVHNARALAAQRRADLDTVDQTTPDRSITLEIGASAEPMIVIGDAPRLHQALANLVTNALVHTPTATPIVVRVSATDTQVRVDVIDSGPGLSAADAAQVFERFYRIDNSRSRASGGSGLGLSIVRAIATAHGGAVAVGPTPGGGATFTLDLPKEPPPHEQDPPTRRDHLE